MITARCTYIFISLDEHRKNRETFYATEQGARGATCTHAVSSAHIRTTKSSYTLYRPTRLAYTRSQSGSATHFIRAPSPSIARISLDEPSLPFSARHRTSSARPSRGALAACDELAHAEHVRAAWRMTALADERPESTSHGGGRGVTGGRIAAMRRRIERSCDSRIARGCAVVGIAVSATRATEDGAGAMVK